MPSPQQLARWRAQRADDLEPFHDAVRQLIREVGWDRARIVIAAVLDMPVTHPNGRWWGRVGKRNAKKIIDALHGHHVQERLF